MRRSPNNVTWLTYQHFQELENNVQAIDAAIDVLIHNLITILPRDHDKAGHAFIDAIITKIEKKREGFPLNIHWWQCKSEKTDDGYIEWSEPPIVKATLVKQS